ncbi:hypothetical protein TKK_0013096 [Trichogramma kaykai]|uniref:Uncharacterized protein n=1 Tax=Trichogramma kaykai TaxID=54128 RepID=A0ABD2WJ46_9HYME
MIVLRLILFCLLAQASSTSSSGNTTIRRELLDLVAYRQSKANQGQLYDWLYRLLEHIFAHSHRTTVLFDRAGGSFNNYAPTVIQRRAGRGTIDLAFELFAEDVGLANEDVNYLVMSQTLDFFLRAFDDALHYKYAKYLIGTQMDREEDFRALLRHLEARDYAYVTIVRLVNETRGRIYQLRSQNSTIYPHREQHLVAVLEKPIAEPLSRAEVVRDVRPYSQTICPVKKCRLHANSLKEEIVLTRFRAREYETAVRDLLDTFCDLNRLVDYVYYPLKPAEYWWQLEEQLSQELNGIDVIFGNLLAPPNFTELFDVVCVFK